MAKSSKKRERTEEDVADNHDAKPVLKKSKLDTASKAEVTKKSSELKEVKSEPPTTEETFMSKKGKKDRKDKKGKKEKKRKVKDLETVAQTDEPAPAAPSNLETQTEQPANGDAIANKKNKKKKNKDRKSKSTEHVPIKEDEDDKKALADHHNDYSDNSNKPTRFICFVGNLPYTATVDSVRAHFATLQPTSVRLLTQRDDPSKSRGIAFVEFGRYDHMKTCLSKFHHTEFDDGKSPARRINVELTYVYIYLYELGQRRRLTRLSPVTVNRAGGGGKTAARQDKIKQKNAKLNEERANRMQKEEEEAKLKKAGKTGEGKTQEQRDEDAIHPSRRTRVPYGRN
ncbi:hypothetical protein N657DRAFT_643712 [Parathielavia appendiculata]|uniref:RRM domain-containing protein n=1 Tax=Parathielavia appendiculata TaxID=2587402 RepID=A0AAN6Z4Q7_9PEZI|nr:hypothetical protein N657DRAFT_643712 [Parathielavia appendiculata]